MENLKVALVQFDIIWRDSQSNLNKLEQMFTSIQNQNIDLIVLPEMFNTGFTKETQGVSQDMNGDVLQWMRDQSYKMSTAILGSVIITENGKNYNRALFVNGDKVEYYDKRHLFSYSGEDKEFSMGESRVVIEYKGWKLFPQICYDLRFPVWSRNNLDYDVMIYMANWPMSRISVWKKLLVARSLENMSYVMGVNRVGVDGEGIEYSGHTMLINPLGKKIEKTKRNTEELLILDISKEYLNQVRKKYKFLNDRDEFEIK